MRGDHGPERHDDHGRRARDDTRARAEQRRGRAHDDRRPQADERVHACDRRGRDGLGEEREADRHARERVRDRLRLTHALQLLNRSAACTHNSSSRRDVEVMLRRLRLDEKYGARAARCSVGCDHARAAATKVKESIESFARDCRLPLGNTRTLPRSRLTSAVSASKLRQFCIRSKVGLPAMLSIKSPV